MIFLAGRVTRGLRVVEIVSIVGPPRDKEEACSDIIEETIEAVVCSRVCSASVGALATYERTPQHPEQTYSVRLENLPLEYQHSEA